MLVRIWRDWNTQVFLIGMEISTTTLENCTAVKVKLLSHVRLFVTPWTAAHQAPLPMGFSRQEYWSGVPLPSPSVQLIASKCLFPQIHIPSSPALIILIPRSLFH